MPNQATYPVRILREHITALEAALSVCLAEPNLRAVHRLRTGTRRLEAQLLLLDLLPEAPEHRELSAALRRQLRRLRRAAGEVRDLDVHTQHLVRLEATHPTAPSPAASPAPVLPVPAAGPEATSATGTPETALRHGSAKLAERLGRKRTRAAAELQKLLAHHQAKTALAAEALLKALRPAGNLKLSAADLIRATETVLYRDALLHGPETGKLDEDELHAVRKSAKLARYLAETMPADPTVVAAAARFEALQESGGLWHDALEMARAARRYLGRHHPLTVAFAAERRLHLADYRAALRATPPPPSTRPPSTAPSPATSRKSTTPGKTTSRKPASRPKRAAPSRRSAATATLPG